MGIHFTFPLSHPFSLTEMINSSERPEILKYENKSTAHLYKSVNCLTVKKKRKLLRETEAREAQ